MAEPDRISIQHVLISFADAPTEATRSLDEARELADEVLQLARGGEEFTELVRQHSDDPIQPGNPNPGVYQLLNHNVEGRTFAEFVDDLNRRAQEHHQLLATSVQSGDKSPQEAEAEMNTFVQELQAEGDQMNAELPHPRGAMVPAFGDVGFALEVGEVSVAEFSEESSPFGWHVIKRLS